MNYFVDTKLPNVKVVCCSDEENEKLSSLKSPNWQPESEEEIPKWIEEFKEINQLNFI